MPLEQMISEVSFDLYSRITSCTVGKMSFSNPAVKKIPTNCLLLWFLLVMMMAFKLSGSLRCQQVCSTLCQSSLVAAGKLPVKTGVKKTSLSSGDVTWVWSSFLKHLHFVNSTQHRNVSTECLLTSWHQKLLLEYLWGKTSNFVFNSLHHSKF